ncbi:hypothetical protein BC831DRAFT_453530 [Entophlyctis helioformis]|nr:hypothetical protein BC831DRAFT_453530 [Entophlyctis helioformis]
MISGDERRPTSASLQQAAQHKSHALSHIHAVQYPEQHAPSSWLSGEEPHDGAGGSFSISHDALAATRHASQTLQHDQQRVLQARLQQQMQRSLFYSHVRDAPASVTINANKRPRQTTPQAVCETPHRPSHEPDDEPAGDASGSIHSHPSPMDASGSCNEIAPSVLSEDLQAILLKRLDTESFTDKAVARLVQFKLYDRLDDTIGSFPKASLIELVATIKSLHLTFLVITIAPKQFTVVPEPGFTSLKEVKSLLHHRWPKNADTTDKEGQEIHRLADLGPTAYSTVRCAEMLDRWIVRPGTLQLTCKQLLLIYALTMSKLSAYVKYQFKSELALIHKARREAAHEESVATGPLPKKTRVDHSANHDASTVQPVHRPSPTPIDSIKPILPPDTLILSTLPAIQRHRLAAKIRSMDSASIAMAAKLHSGPLPYPASVFMTLIEHLLAPSGLSGHGGASRDQAISGHLAQKQSDEIELVRRLGLTAYARHHGSEQLDLLMTHPNVQQWPLRQIAIVYAGLVDRVLGCATAFANRHPHLFPARHDSLDA